MLPQRLYTGHNPSSPSTEVYPNKSEVRTQSDQSIVDFVGLLIEMTKKNGKQAA